MGRRDADLPPAVLPVVDLDSDVLSESAITSHLVPVADGGNDPAVSERLDERLRLLFGSHLRPCIQDVVLMPDPGSDPEGHEDEAESKRDLQ